MKPIFWCTLLLFLLGAGLTACTPCDGTFVAPLNTAPPHQAMTDSLRPVLTWDYPDGYCDPQEYYVNLFINATNGTVTNSSLGGATGSSARTWTPGVDLTPGMAYLWSVASKNGSLVGEFSFPWQFLVGPACGAADLLSPTPIAPGLDSASTGAEPTFTWGYPASDCAPEGFRLQVSQLSDFGTLAVDMREANPFMAWTPGVPLEDCTDNFWRVAGISGPDDGPWSPVAEFTVNATGPCPCGPDELAQPEAVWPAPYEIVPDLEPGLEWNFPGTCEVGGYAVHLSPTFDMSDTSLFGGTGSPGTVWGPGEPLEPATQYWWQVAAGVGTDFGPYSVKRSFFTGPECSPLVGLPAPELISPANGEYLSELMAWLHYKPGDPGCIPDGYLLDLQTDPSFGGTNLLAEYDTPATTVITDSLEDCTTYYWRVAAVQGGSPGPYSDRRWFRTNQSGTCLFPSHPAWVLENVNCRLCGSTLCMIRYIFEKGTLADVLGRSVDGFFFKLRNPNGGECYAPSDSFDLPVDRELVEMVRMPPTPTPVPTPTPAPLVCASDLKEKQCLATGGKWEPRKQVCICPK